MKKILGIFAIIFLLQGCGEPNIRTQVDYHREQIENLVLADAIDRNIIPQGERDDWTLRSTVRRHQGRGGATFSIDISLSKNTIVHTYNRSMIENVIMRDAFKDTPDIPTRHRSISFWPEDNIDYKFVVVKAQML